MLEFYMVRLDLCLWCVGKANSSLRCEWQKVMCSIQVVGQVKSYGVSNYRIEIISKITCALTMNRLLTLIVYTCCPRKMYPH